MHIGNQIINELKATGWEVDGLEATKLIEGLAPAGTFSDGARRINLELNDTFRWLSRVDGWGHVEKDVDLRDFDTASQAIAAVMFMTHSDFTAYVNRRADTGMTRTQIAAEIATGRSQFFDYLNGKADVPLRVELLCQAVDRLHKGDE